ncbi:BTB/POZ domain-containing protein KCTD21-like isoform X2 [Stylophora pistillata]|nr:BTB/POZ domain-containing protein KCTD21-like isoform X2 [Stylophora pistillata]
MAFSKKPKVQNTAVVKLNIGGDCYTTSRPTLTKYPGTKLADIFSPKSTTIRAEDCTFFFDRDGTHFKFILNYLRTGKLTLPEGETALRQLQEEADFYQIKAMLDELEFNSEILTNKEHRSLLLRWLPPQNTENRRRSLRLLFRASQDGFRAKTFHSKCDSKGPTPTIVQSGDYVFGGFTEESWSSQGGYATCTEAFLFSIVNPRGLEPTKMPLKQQDQQYAIY